MSQIDGEQIHFTQRSCHDCKKQYVTTIVKIGNSYFPKESRCPPCQVSYNEYRQEEYISEAMRDLEFDRRVEAGEIDVNGNEIDD